MTMNILSIQSHVAYGHVGNSAATFIMQRLGVEVWPVNTVCFSNHSGYGGFSGHVAKPDEISTLIEGLASLAVLKRCDAVLSGYVGALESGPVILDAVTTVRRANPQALYCCDPVIGDAGSGIYVRPGVAEFLRDRGVPAADIVTPNQFELEHLCASKVATRGDLVAALRRLRDRGPRVVLVTSLVTADTPPDAIDIVVSDDQHVYLTRTPRLDRVFNGAGDAMAALFLVHYLRSRSAPQALGACVASVFGVVRRTAEPGSRELLLIEAQEELVRPSRSFSVEAIASID
jgi:pyridoxine kinase